MVLRSCRSLRQEQDISRLNVGPPTGIFPERGNRGQRLDPLPALDDEGVVPKTLADRRRIGISILVSAGQELEQDYGPVAIDRSPCTVQHLALAALHVGLEETHV